MKLKDRKVVVAEMDLQVPAFYKEQGIPKVRWMYPGKCYKALKYGELFEVPQHVTKTVGNVSETPKVVTKEAESVTDMGVLVTITPPEPSVQYEQLTLF